MSLAPINLKSRAIWARLLDPLAISFRPPRPRFRSSHQAWWRRERDLAWASELQPDPRARLSRPMNEPPQVDGRVGARRFQPANILAVPPVRHASLAKQAEGSLVWLDRFTHLPFARQTLRRTFAKAESDAAELATHSTSKRSVEVFPGGANARTTGVSQ